MIIDIFTSIHDMLIDETEINISVKQEIFKKVGNISIKQFIESLQVRIKKFDANEVEIINNILAKYELNVNMKSNEIDYYQDNMRRMFYSNIIKEVEIVEHEEKQNQYIEKKEICLQTKEIVSPKIDEKEREVSTKEATKLSKKYFEFKNKNNKIDKPKTIEKIYYDETNNNSVESMVCSYINNCCSFFTTTDIVTSLCKNNNVKVSAPSVYYILKTLILKGFISIVYVDFKPYRKAQIYVRKDVGENLTYKDYYKYLTSKNFLFKVLKSLPETFYRKEFEEIFKIENKPYKNQINYLVQWNRIERVKKDIYKRTAFLTGPLILES